jgi:dihydroxyacetone kinase phosphotransfer subunit
VSNVSLVIVSHSPKIAEGTADMVRQMVCEKVPIAHCGGNSEGGLGTSVAAITACIQKVWSPAGVAVLVDLGGAETNSEIAIEKLSHRMQKLVRICNAPIVEGAVMAAAESLGGADLNSVCAVAEELSAVGGR